MPNRSPYLTVAILEFQAKTSPVLIILSINLCACLALLMCLLGLKMSVVLLCYTVNMVSARLCGLYGDVINRYCRYDSGAVAMFLYLHCDEPIVHHHLLGQEVSSYCSFVLVTELPIHILVHQGGLPNSEKERDMKGKRGGQQAGERKVLKISIHLFTWLHYSIYPVSSNGERRTMANGSWAKLNEEQREIRHH